MKKYFGALIGLSLSAFACGETIPPKGQLMLAFQTDMRLPDDIDQVRIEVTRFGKLEFGRTYEVGEGKVKLPATLGIVAGENPADPVQIRVIALRGGKPEVLRQAVTTIPASRTATLRMPIQWLCYGPRSVVGDSETTAANSCDAGKTCASGTCVDETIDSSTLEAYEPAKIFGGGDGSGGGSCFDVDRCLSSTLQPLEPLHGSSTKDGVTTPSCAVPIPAGADETQLNVGIFVRPGGDICEQTGCVVPLDRADGVGWSIVDGTIQLPLSLCTLAEAGKIDVMVSKGCPSKVDGLPACGAWSSAGNEGSVGGDASSASEGGPLLSDTRSAVVDIAIGGEGPSSRAYFTTQEGKVSACDAAGCQSRIVYANASNVSRLAGTPRHFAYVQPEADYEYLYRCSVSDPFADCVSFAHMTPGKPFVAIPEADDSSAFWFTSESGVDTMRGTIVSTSDGIGTVRYQAPSGRAVSAFRGSSSELVWLEEGTPRTLTHCAKPIAGAACSAFPVTSEVTGIVEKSLMVAGSHVSWRTDTAALVTFDLANPPTSPVTIGSGALVAAAMDGGIFIAKADRTVRFVSYTGRETIAFTAAAPVVVMAADATNLFYATDDRKLWRYTHGR